jgi:hypothetical protein
MGKAFPPWKPHMMQFAVLCLDFWTEHQQSVQPVSRYGYTLPDGFKGLDGEACAFPGC